MGYVNGASTTAVAIIFIIFPVLAVGMRFGARRYKNLQLGVDDWLSVPALLFTLVIEIVLLIGAAEQIWGWNSTPGNGSALGDQQYKFVALKKLQYLGTVFRSPAIGCIKLSLLFLFRRLFNGRLFTLVNWTAIALVSAWTVCFTAVEIFNCGVPASKIWSSGSQATACVDEQIEGIAQVATDIALDVLVLSIPIPVIWSLRMRFKKKASVSAVFLLGAFSMGAAIARLVIYVAFHNAFHNPQQASILGLSKKDILGSTSITQFWISVEVGTAMVVSSMPPLWPLVHCSDPYMSALRHVVSFVSLRSGSVSCPSGISTEVGRGGWGRREKGQAGQEMVVSRGVASSDEEPINAGAGHGHNARQDSGETTAENQVGVLTEVQVTSETRPESYEIATADLEAQFLSGRERKGWEVK